jgi:prepilin-type N-terminal cleavage/methylation domain-containing protein
MKQRGFTLVEMTLVTAIMAMIIAGTASLFSNSIRSFTRTTNQFDSDMSASTALQIVNRDLQEAKQVSIISPTRIRVYYPVLEANGTYNRMTLDTVNTVDFFRGDINGAEDSTGACLVRLPAGAAGRAICKDVVDLEFRSISPSSVDVTLRTERRTDTVVGRTEMIHRAIFLRNY